MATVVAERPLRLHVGRAMGTDLELLGLGMDRESLDGAVRAIGLLEERWSRFRPTSDLCVLNLAGAAVDLPPVTFDLVVLAVDAWRRTGGWFDPTVLPALEAAGYDRSFEEVEDDPRPPDSSEPAPGAAGIVIEPGRRAVTLGRARLDLGGVGKGRAADLVADCWGRQGLSGCVNLGGDLRVVGEGPDGAWSAEVVDPFAPGCSLAVIGIAEGAIATSATTKRSWSRGTTRCHHLIDPHTGRPSAIADGQVTVVAGTAAEAEVWAKAALLAGPDGPALLAGAGLPGLFVGRDGMTPVNGMEAYLW